MIGKIVATTESPSSENNTTDSPFRQRKNKARKENGDFILRRVEKANREMLKIRFQNRIEERKRELLEKQKEEEEENQMMML
jgi:hypothetical protein